MHINKIKTVTVFFGTFCFISLLVFQQINSVTKYVIDEEFHVPQGLQYCNLNFTTWDPKITTLPGLYIISTLLMAPLQLCTIYWLRFTNLLASVVNTGLLIWLFHQKDSKSLSWESICSGINMSLLPPLYFFAHLYYTDTVSVSAVLLAMIFAERRQHVKAAFFGALAVFIRQNNIIWVFFIAANFHLDLIVRLTNTRLVRTFQNIRLSEIQKSIQSIKSFSGKPYNLNKLLRKDVIASLSYIVVFVLFALFLVINGSIVVGDKTAHQATIHIPQIFYFSIFCLVFAMPHLLYQIMPFFKYVHKNKTFCLIAIAICIYVVHVNTLVHPYLLADNRHYTFYVWKNIYGKFFWAKYVLVPLYLFCIYAVINATDPAKNIQYLFLYCFSLFFVLSLQKMIEVRYFILPFIFIRYRFKTTNLYVLCAEFFLYLIINIVTFYIFFTKTTYWPDFSYAQRIMW